MKIGKRRRLAILIPSLVLGGCTSEPPPTIESVQSTSQASSDSTSWSIIANMNAERKAHAALKLEDKRVLVVGGTEDPTQTAELYDPDNGQWTPLAVPQDVVIPADTTCRPALAQLSNGRVLVVSGTSVWSVDLSQNEWLPASPAMTVSTCKPKVVALPVNRALILADSGTGEAFIYNLGAINPTSTPIPTPTKGTWFDAAVISLADDRVLISGGANHHDEAVIFDPELMNDTWITAGNMFFGRSEHTLALLPNRNVLAAGGVTAETNKGQYSNTAEIFNVSVRQWVPTTIMQNYRDMGPKAVRLPSGFILVVGGSNTSTAELFDPSTSEWSPVESSNDIRYSGHESTVLDDGRVLVTGGQLGVATNQAALCDALAFAWEEVSELPAENRVFHTATKLDDGRLLIVGGRNSGTNAILTDAWLYEPPVTNGASGQWSQVTSTKADNAQHTATKLENGQVLIVGGAIPKLFTPSSTTPTDAQWTETTTENAPANLGGATATLLNDGKVLIVGGFLTDGSFSASKKVYLYDPTANTWENDLPFPTGFTGAIGHSATLLDDGTVLVAGGFAECPKTDTTVVARESAARFIPEQKTWESVDSMGQPRAFHSATLIANGHVVFTGGGGAISDSCEQPSWGSVYTSTVIYEPLKTDGSPWVYAGTMAAPRAGHQAVLLDHGRLLVGGGVRDGFGNASSSAEIFDTIDQTWSSTSRMRFARYGHTLTLLADGIIALGGFLPFAPSGTQETFVERFPQADLGEKCTSDDQCSSNFCTDGVCCNESCNSECLSCTKVGYKNTTLGEGYCEDVSGCSPFACNIDTGGCGMTCTNVTECATGFVCDPTGECVPPVPNASKINETGCAAAPTESNSISWISLAVIASAYAFRRRNAQRKS